MSRIEGRAFIKGIGAAVGLAPGNRLRAAKSAGREHPALTKVNRKFLPTATEVRTWHAIKDSKAGPTLTASPSRHNYLEMLEREWMEKTSGSRFAIASLASLLARLQLQRHPPSGR